MQDRGISFKDALNSAVKAGLTQPKGARRSFAQKTFRLGWEQNFRWDKALETAAVIEDG